MKSRWKRTVIYVLLRLIRLSLDFISNIIFGIINYRMPEKIKPVTDPILLETAQSLAEKIRKRKLKSVDVIKAYITRIREVNPTLNIISDERFKDALQDAEKADQFIESEKNSVKVLEDLYPYLGVPFTTKESMSVQGMLNTAGLYSSKGRRASKDSDTVVLMKKAGGIPLAVTNVPELTMWWETYNNVYGKSRNPYDPRRIVGGSSGGEGALLGAGGSVIGIGSDVGGSIRIPSFVNGIFGLKPSKGIVSNIGQVPDNGHLYDDFLSTGPMCRYATDLLPMLKVLADKNVSKLRLDRKIDLSKIKIYYMDEAGHPFCTRVTSEMKQAQMKVKL
ncbi:fatty-acid amide hydrolase 2-A-like [Centruroides sculpturatus]|uniref:fatty-acid amide hydrolase 2-A-like n=1 Tax=Centruroides sculpturatus TaxID=218467 RepID=UPI000C6E5137|nr:fatty-acid amide hydrolase 2-A-like [Centruroides sculpturatus]